MTTATGVYRKGRILLDRPVDWQDGARVRVRPEKESLGLREEDWPDTPEARTELLRRFEALQPLDFTDEEESLIAAAHKSVREVTLRAVRKQMRRKS
jgi:hypothetical protein